MTWNNGNEIKNIVICCYWQYYINNNYNVNKYYYLLYISSNVYNSVFDVVVKRL